MAPFLGRTPESLIPRSDSKNPATTCKGITKTGRPCRRNIDAKPDNGVLAVVSVASDSDEDDTGAAAFFCWQHKDQAEQLVASNAPGPGPHRQDTQLYPLQERNSIDTLVARLGVLEVEDSTPKKKKRRSSKVENGRADGRPPRRVNRPPTWDRVQGPLMSVPGDLMAQQNRLNQRPQQKKKQSFWTSLCCGAADDDYVEVVRHKRRQSQGQPPSAPQYSSQPPMTQRPPRTQQPRPNAPSLTPVPAPASAHRPSSSSLPARKPLSSKPARPVNKTSPQSLTTSLLSYIPKTLSPALTSALLAELSKPISAHDDPGYIYIFWLTPESLGPAPSSTASTLLAPPTRPEASRRTSDVLRQYSVKRPQRLSPNRRANASRGNTSGPIDETSSDTILLKIGRANNVTRRMHEWTRQCGYSLSLVRFYPYVSATPTPSPTPSPHASPAHSRRPSYQTQRSASDNVRKVPHAHRVERLVHIELGEQRVMKKCDACGKEHREWFEVPATREGVKGVDEVVKRWVGWAEEANA